MIWSPQALSPADPQDSPAPLWRHRARVIEAAAWLAAARLLVTLAPLARWERTLGRRIAPSDPARQISPAQALRSRRIGRAVDQAAARLPFSLKCLPKAMAAQWMLRRRRIAARLLIGVLAAGTRGTPDDLHAWVLAGTETVIGDFPDAHHPVLAVQCE